MLTVITPHPLEAARLLNTDSATVQHDRLRAAQTLANELQCTAVLKGSGTVIAKSGEVPTVNFTGNARLATGGTGDVLAGMVGASRERVNKAIASFIRLGWIDQHERHYTILKRDALELRAR